MNKTISLTLALLYLLLNPLSGGAQHYSATATAAGSSQPDLPELDCVIEPSEIVDAGTAVPGLIEAIYADRSDILNKGAVIAKLESSVEQATLARARAQAGMSTSIELREETVALGKVTQKRNEELLHISAISLHDMDQLRTENRIAALQVKQEKHNKHIAELEYQRAQAALDRMTIRSPIDGVVMDRFKSIGEYVEDEAVLRIAKLDPLFIEVVVPVDYLGQISAGMRAEVLPSAGGQIKHIATVERVDRVADAASGTYGVRLSLANPDYSVAAGLRCKLAFLSTQPGQSGGTDPYTSHSNQQLRDTRQQWVRTEKAAAIETSSPRAQALPAATKAPAAAVETRAAVELPVAEQQQASLPARPVEVQPVLLHPAAVSAPEQPTATAISKLASDASGKVLQACYSLGPIADKPLAQQLSAQLTEYTAAAAIHDETVEVTKAWLILSAAMPTRTETRALLDDIRAAGITDSAILHSGTYKGRISVGYYNKHRSALRHQQTVARKGFTTEIVPMTSAKNQYWLDIAVRESDAAQDRLQQLTDNLPASITLKALTCAPQMAGR